MEYDAIVAGTGYEGRAKRIRMCARQGMPVYLVPEPENEHDVNAVAVYLKVRAWYTLFQKTDIQIGYIKKRLANTLTKRLSTGGRIKSARIKSLYLPLDHPRVSLSIEADW